MDKKHGYGVFKWSSGNVYKGNYKEDVRHGYGEMYWTDGSIYKGEWVKGIQHGFGEMIFPDGTKKVGIFDHNTFVSSAELPQHIKQQQSDMSVMLSRHNMQNQERKIKPLAPFHSQKNSFDDQLKLRSPVHMPSYLHYTSEYQYDPSYAISSKSRRTAKRERLPAIQRDATTNYGKRDRSTHSRLNQTSSDFSYVEDNIKDYILTSAAKQRLNSKQSKGKPIWRPTGRVPEKNGYTHIQKLFF